MHAAWCAFAHRRTMPFRFVWPVIAFFPVNMVTATMFLRWHWVVDVVAGLLLATTAAFVSRAVVAWESRRRRDRGLPPVFASLVWPKSEVSKPSPDDHANSC